MGEKRAVQVSHELWRQMMTQGHASAGVRCIEGIPEDAQFVTAFPAYVSAKPDPVFVFESDNWDTPTPEYTVREPFTDEAIPSMNVIFQTAECRTCKWWDPSSHKLTGECRLTRDDDYVPVHKESLARAVSSGDDPHPTSWLQTETGFACTQYEPRGRG